MQYDINPITSTDIRANIGILPIRPKLPILTILADIEIWNYDPNPKTW